MVKNLPASTGDARDVGSVPESGRSSGERNGNPLQYSRPEEFLPVSHRHRSLAGYSPRGRRESDTNEHTVTSDCAPFETLDVY